MPALVRRVAVSLCVLAACAETTLAQAGDDGTCLRFTFGTWTPSLDWARAGHPGIDTAGVARDEAGRGWASQAGVSSGDTVLVLFPPWWAAGVSVSLGTKPAAIGDTVTGRATALVADAAITSPTSRVRAWRVACRPPTAHLDGHPARASSPFRTRTDPVARVH